jgi:hypothetical protein
MEKKVSEIQIKKTKGKGEPNILSCEECSSTLLLTNMVDYIQLILARHDLFLISFYRYI